MNVVHVMSADNIDGKTGLGKGFLTMSNRTTPNSPIMPIDDAAVQRQLVRSCYYNIYLVG